MAEGQAPVGFEQYVAARQAGLLRTAYLLTGHRHDAEDLVQSALMKVVPHWHRIEGDPDAYVRRVLVRENVSRWRRRRWREVLGAEARPAPEAAATDRDPGDRLDLLRALSALAPRQRAVVVLRFLEDRSVAETAAALGVGEGTVKSQTSDALARLRTLLPGLVATASDRDAWQHRDHGLRNPSLPHR